MECIDLTEHTIKIVGIFFSYNKKLEQKDKFLSHFVEFKNILKLWKLRH